MFDQYTFSFRLYALPLSDCFRMIPLRDHRIIKTQNSWREFLHHRNDQSASLLFKGNNVTANLSAIFRNVSARYDSPALIIVI